MTELPGSWATAAIRDIANTSSGGTPSRGKPQYFGGSIPWVKSGELNDGLVRSTEETITEEGLKNSSAKIFPAGTVCIALYGATVGRTGILGIDASTNQAVCGIQPKDGIRRNYLLYFLQSQRANLVRLSQGGAQPNISQELVRSTEVPLAPSHEQDRIVAEIEKQFTRLDAATAALKRVRTNLKGYRASVLKAACEGRLVPTEAELARKEGRDYEPADQLLQRILRERRARWEADTLAKMIASGKPPKDDGWRQKYKEPFAPDTTNLPELPEGWCWVTLDSIIDDITAGRSYKCEERPPEANEFGIVKVSAVTWGTFDEAESKTCSPHSSWTAEFAIRSGDFLFSRANTIDLVGACVIAGQIGRRLMLSDKILRFECSDLLLKKWLLIVLRSKWGRFEIERLSTGNQESMRNIGQDRIRRIRIPLAPPAEIARIVPQLESSQEAQEGMERATDLATRKALRVRQAILRDAFSGLLTEQTPSDEPASALLVRVRAERTAKHTSSKPRRKEEPAYA